jgi:hypothetical protein
MLANMVMVCDAGRGIVKERDAMSQTQLCFASVFLFLRQGVQTDRIRFPIGG